MTLAEMKSEFPQVIDAAKRLAKLAKRKQTISARLDADAIRQEMAAGGWSGLLASAERQMEAKS